MTASIRICLVARKAIRPLRTEVDYEAALADIERYFEQEPRPGTPEADRFDLLALVIGDYENKRWPIEPRGRRKLGAVASSSGNR